MAFLKDRWILDAIRRRYIIVREDGTILRAKKATKDGIVDVARGYSVVVQQVHKATGRVYFNLSWRGHRKSVLTNRVVALRYHENPLNLPVVNHIDGDKENNAKDNLEWSTGSDNEKHAHRTGLKTGRGSSNANARLTVEDVLAIRASDDPASLLAERHDVSRSTITSILSGRTWKHV